MKFIKNYKLFEELSDDKYLINLSSANCRGILGMSNPSEEIKLDVEKWWSLNCDYIAKINVHGRYRHLPNDILTKLSACREDVEKFGQAYITSISGLTESEVRRFRLNLSADDLSNRASAIFSKAVKKFKGMTLDQKFVFFREMEADDYLIIRSSYIYKIVDGKDLISEAMAFSNKLLTIKDEG